MLTQGNNKALHELDTELEVVWPPLWLNAVPEVISPD